MMTLAPLPEFPSDYKSGRVPKFAQRSKELDLSQMTTQQVKAEARRILTAGLSPLTWQALDLLACGGVMSSSRLMLADRTLRKLAQLRLLERLALREEALQQAFATLGLTDLYPALYTLGPIGIEIATGRHDVPPPGGYQGYTLARVLHDVITNEIVLRLAAAIGARGWQVEWLGKYEATLTDQAQKQTLLEPDALLRFHRDGQEGAFLLEYHNEDRQTRAAGKVEKYETAFNEGNWRERWEVETFPPVLVVFWQPIVGTGYHSATYGKRLHCTYYGKTLQAVLDGKLNGWINVSTKEALPILPPEQQE